MQVDHLSDDPLATRFFGVLLRLVKGSQHRAMAITADYDLTLTQLRLLYVLEHADEPLPVGALGDAVALSVPAAGRAVDALHRAGLVSRNEDPADRRIKRIALSDAGHEAIDRITRARFGAVSDFVSALDETERRALGDAIEVLAGLADLHFPPPAPPGRAPAQTSSPSQETTA